MVAGLGASGCDRRVPVAGAVAIDGAPVYVPFAGPVTPAGADRAVCFEFNPPGESHQAHQITVVLLTEAGGRDTMRAAADRTGESTVCLRDTSAAAASHTYGGAELSSPVPVRIHSIFWGGPQANTTRTR
jgi:hypothetical protein